MNSKCLQQYSLRVQKNGYMTKPEMVKGDSNLMHQNLFEDTTATFFVANGLREHEPDISTCLRAGIMQILSCLVSLFTQP